MAGPFYFAWVGGAVDPAYTLETTGDVWSGSLSTAGDMWNGTLVTTADTVRNSTSLANLADTTSLRVGKTYTVKGSGIPDGTTFVYDGSHTQTLSAAATTGGNGVAVTITNTAEETIIANLDSTDGLVVGRTYNIAASGIKLGTTFTYAGGDSITISNAALATTEGASLTITLNDFRDLITGVASVAGLVSGQIYSAVALGLAAGTTFTYDGSPNTLTLYQDATGNGTAVPLTISKGPTEADGGAFDSSVHAVEDEDIFEFEIEHNEGDAPVLRIDVINPKVGLLRSSRKRWCWFSWDKNWDASNPDRVPSSSDLVSLFHGRLVGSPEYINEELVRFEFHAKPSDYAQQKAALAKTLRDLPYVDPVFIAADKLADPDTVLETRTLQWHVGRTDLTVLTSDILGGEDGTIEVLDSEHFYDGLSVSYGEAPLRQIAGSLTVTWSQAAEGDVDLTDKIYQKFVDQGSPYSSPNVSSLTSDGLLSSWPQAGASIGAGWSMSIESYAETAAAWLHTETYIKTYTAKDITSSTKDSVTITADLVENSTTVTNIESPDDATTFPKIGNVYDLSTNSALDPDATLTMSSATSGTLSIPALSTVVRTTLDMLKHDTTITSSSSLQTGYADFQITFDLVPINYYFLVHYIAARDRSETLYFTMTADTQLFLTDNEGSDIDVVTLSSDTVDKPIDLDLTIPLGDTGRNCYFPTDRGMQSAQFGLLYARAKMRSRSRAVKIKFEPFFEICEVISCRKNVLLHDDRFAGSPISGKVINYKLTGSGSDGTTRAEVTIGCAVGHDVALATATPGQDDYADDYVDDWTESTGGQVDILEGELQYNSLEGTYVLDDDGLDLSNMVPDTVIRTLTLTGGPDDQKAAIDASTGSGSDGKPIDAIKAVPTRVELILVPVTGGAFHTDYSLKVSQLTLPKTIDLES